ncbi:hypothetical protein DAEQUDRAFT_814404 [Daedalea quercina L-15889]|uniref:Uncharacterized protein n=1 Tax=Daedalea quercina L-15889 TaxID=1314783 RepID=A0A165M582_9APHY|nr:hypothetical protein DAEQUDRAFT_814404 [Daedalea quercina L-15889]
MKNKKICVVLAPPAPICRKTTGTVLCVEAEELAHPLPESGRCCTNGPKNPNSVHANVAQLVASSLLSLVFGLGTLYSARPPSNIATIKMAKKSDVQEGPKSKQFAVQDEQRGTRVSYSRLAGASGCSEPSFAATSEAPEDVDDASSLPAISGPADSNPTPTPDAISGQREPSRTLEHAPAVPLDIAQRYGSPVSPPGLTQRDCGVKKVKTTQQAPMVAGPTDDINGTIESVSGQHSVTTLLATELAAAQGVLQGLTLQLDTLVLNTPDNGTLIHTSQESTWAFPNELISIKLPDTRSDEEEEVIQDPEAEHYAAHLWSTPSAGGTEPPAPATGEDT